jgi:hypothetical protein
MRQINAVFASDSLCRDNTRFTSGALVNGLRGAWQTGTPSFLSHDLHRPIGWTVPTAVYLEPGLSRLCGRIVLADEESDGPAVQSVVLRFLHERVKENDPEFEVLLRGLGDALRGSGDRVVAECIAIREPGLALRRFPKLFELRDDDGLIPITELDALAPGVYRLGELVVFAHSFFRRGLSPLNTLNGAFLRSLHAVDKSARPRVALDPDMVGLATTYRWQLEHQYWWGPLFSDDLATIPTGVTRHEATDEQRFYHGISRTEFWWQSRKGEHILEVEELRDDPTFDTPPNSSFGCRYAHSIVAEPNGNILHFDGAVRCYTEEQMIERLEIDLPSTGRDKEYTKLWRIDGDVDVATWKRLLSDYFRDNHLIGEYLGADAKSIQEVRADQSQGTLSTPRSRAETLVPIGRGLGPRLTLYFRPVIAAAADRVIVPLRGHGVGRDEKPFVELSTLELVKAIRCLGEEVDFDDQVPLYEADDHYYNLPMLWHRSAAGVGGSVEALRMLTAAWIADGVDGAVSFTLAYPIADDVGCAISIRGHVADINLLLTRWEKQVRPHLPTPEELANALASELSQWPETHDDHRHFRSVFQNGILDYPRLILDASEVARVYMDEAGSVQAELMVNVDSDPALTAALQSGKLTLRPVWLVDDPGCQKCGGHYRNCECSSLLDQSVVHMRGARLVQLMLTDRPS